MPSRKKAKGKARKAVKEAKAKEGESRAVISANQRLEGSLEAQLQQLMVSAASELCRHGYPSLSAGEEIMFADFMNAFIAAFLKKDNMAEGFTAAQEVTEEKYPSIYSSKLEALIPFLLSSGTKMILVGDKRAARLNAMLTFYFDGYMAVEVHKTRGVACPAKLLELYGADEHTLVSYYRKRIPCSCLDEKYKEVKSIKKMGFCCNASCSEPGRKVERSKMLCCTRCAQANYCSVECQRADWKRHKEYCGMAAKMKAAFDSNQT